MVFIYCLGLIPTALFLLFLIMMLAVDKYYVNKKTSFFKYKSSLAYTGRNEQLSDMMLANIFFFVYILLLLAMVLSFFNVEYYNYCKVFLEHINSIEGILMSYFGVVIAVIILSVTLGPKEYYLTVTRAELHKHYLVHVVYQVLGLASFFSMACVAVLQSPDLNKMRDFLIFVVYEICCLLIAVGGLYILWIIGLLAIGQRRMELYSLNNLYTIFWNNSILKLVNKTEDVIYENLGYLLNKYTKVKLFTGQRLSTIQGIVYKEEISNIQYWRNFAKARLCIVLTVLAIVFPLWYYTNGQKIFFGVNLILIIFCWGVLNNKITKPIFEKYAVNLLLGRSGYEITCLNEKKYFVGDLAWCSDPQIKKYIRNIKNIMALYCIICKCWNEPQVIIDSFEEFIDYLKENDKTESNFEKALFYLPVFASAYYYYICFDKESFPKCVTELFATLKLNKEGKERFYVILNSLIWDASRFRPSEEDRKIRKSGRWSSLYYKQYIANNGYWLLLLSGSYKK